MIWLKVLHLVALVSWFAGLFYLPRLFVYHTQHRDGPVHAQFQIMERKLYRFIMNPAMAVTVLSGAALAGGQWAYVSATGWFWVKMVLVVTLVLFHLSLGRSVARFAAGTDTRSERFYRLFNEVPTVALIAIVVLAVVRPF